MQQRSGAAWRIGLERCKILKMVHKGKLSRSGPIRQQAADALEEMILAGHYLAGQKIPQARLAREFGLSQGSVREALQELEARGLIIKAGRTWRVVRLSEDDVSNIYQVRAVLEPLACKLAAQVWDQRLRVRLEELLAVMQHAAEDRDYRRHSQADMKFHQAIWAHQPNRYLEKLLSQLCMPLFAYDLVQRAARAYLNFERSLRQHSFIIDVLQCRDGERAGRIIGRLIQRFYRQDVEDFRNLESMHAPSEFRNSSEC